MAWTHPTKFRHYMQLYPQGNKTYAETDIEAAFFCRYVSLDNATAPSIKSVYMEDFAEHDGKRVWTDSDPIYNASELTLTMRWRSDECGDVQEWSEKFTKYIMGRKFQYHDTFRPDKFWQFICKDAPTIKAEKLHGASQYRYVSYKLTNFGGKPTEESQL